MIFNMWASVVNTARGRSFHFSHCIYIIYKYLFMRSLNRTIILSVALLLFVLILFRSYLLIQSIVLRAYRKLSEYLIGSIQFGLFYKMTVKLLIRVRVFTH